MDFGIKPTIIDGQREQGTINFLQSSCNILQDAQVWPPAPDDICGEVTATYNFVTVKMCSLLCHYNLVASNFDTLKTDKVIGATLNRVYNCVSGYDLIDDSIEEESVSLKLLKIVKALENPVFHFRSLKILGRLILLVTSTCLYKRLFHGYSQEVVTCLVRFAELAGVPVLKESCHFHHNLLLTYPLPKGVTEEEVNIVTVGDMVCLFLTAFQQPASHFVMEHDSWKWLFAAIECRNLMLRNLYSPAIQKLQVVLSDCLDPQNKGRLLCLFAECYFHLGCPQLSIQAYRDALQTDPKRFCILHGLSLVYQSMDLPELELESLNLCVMALADENIREVDCVPLVGVDELLWSSVPPTPDISYVRAKVTFAKRCLQLKRYPEAAEQYSSLIGMLQREDMFLQFEKHELNQELNIAEILVEAAEVLVITHQYQDCIRLCDNTQSSLSADETMAKHNQSLATVNSLECSQSDIFNLLEDSPSLDSFGPLSVLPSKKLKPLLTGGFHLSADLCDSFEKSRKRMRSAEPFNREGKETVTCRNSEDTLLARLLLCKVDALVLSEGFTDAAVSCLQQSLDILIHHHSSPPQTPDKFSHPGTDASATPCKPHPKRQRISSDGTAVLRAHNQSLDGIFDSPRGSDREWSRLLLDAALRMATASCKRKRFSSVINSCRVVDQLDKGNTDAIYMKTIVMSENGGLGMEAIVNWFNHRGVTYLVDRKELEQAMKRLQETSLIPYATVESSWWHWKERDFLDLDVHCLQLFLNIQSTSRRK